MGAIWPEMDKNGPKRRDSGKRISRGRRPRTYSPEEWRLILRAARGHWCGAAVRWMFHTGMPRARICALLWRDIEPLDEAGPMYQELCHLQYERSQLPRVLRRDPGSLPVFLNRRGGRLNPATFADLLRDLLKAELLRDLLKAERVKERGGNGR